MEFINFTESDLLNTQQTDPLADLFTLADNLPTPQNRTPNNPPTTDPFTATGGSFEYQWNGPTSMDLDQLDLPSVSNLSNIFDTARTAAQNLLTDSILPPAGNARDNRAPHIGDVAENRLPQPPFQAIAHPNDFQVNEPDNQQRPGRKRNRLGRFVNTTSSPSTEDTDDDPFADLSEEEDDNDNTDCTDPSYEPSNSDNDNNVSPSEDDLDALDEVVHCSICNKKFGDKDSLTRHYARLHSQPPPQSSQGCRCEICNAPFKNEINLKRHINNAHTGKLNYKCKVCSAGFATDRGLSLHIGKEHSDKKLEEGGPKRKRRRKTNKVYECDFCSYKSDQRFNVTRHFKSQHTNQEKWYCPYGCGKVCKSKANMKTHTMSCRQRPT